MGLSLWLFLELMWNLVSRNSVCLFHQLITCSTSQKIDGELYHLFAIGKYKQE